MQSQREPGKVYFVGAGPGDAGLITLRGVECLRQADLVLYDYLVNPRILEHAAAEAELLCLGRHGQGRILPQEEITTRLVDAALAGKTVVRLKGGDTAVFARTAQEAEAVAAANIPYEIVPGITAALAAGSFAGISLTDRSLSSAVALVTGQQRSEPSGEAAPLDYRQLAGFPGTLVFYMGVTTAPHWARELIDAGKPPQTPVAIVRRCSWSDQQTWRCTLVELADILKSRHIRPPAVIIVGDVVAGETTSWFTERPLFGKTVLVTRPVHQTDSLRRPLELLGATVLVQPAIEIAPPEDWTAVDRALENIGGYHWLVFSSANGVSSFLDRLEQSGGDLRRLATVRIAAIGPGTADELARYRLKADLVPAEFRAESLAEALSGEAAGGRFLLIRASRGREVLRESLVAAGGEVDQVVAYQSLDVEQPAQEIATALEDNQIDWVTVTSSAIARSLVRMFGDRLRHARLASISPITSQTLRELGHSPAAEAGDYTMQGVVEAIAGSDATSGRET